MKLEIFGSAENKTIKLPYSQSFTHTHSQLHTLIFFIFSFVMLFHWAFSVLFNHFSKLNSYVGSEHGSVKTYF